MSAQRAHYNKKSFKFNMLKLHVGKIDLLTNSGEVRGHICVFILKQSITSCEPWQFNTSENDTQEQINLKSFYGGHLHHRAWNEKRNSTDKRHVVETADEFFHLCFSNVSWFQIRLIVWWDVFQNKGQCKGEEHFPASCDLLDKWVYVHESLFAVQTVSVFLSCCDDSNCRWTSVKTWTLFFFQLGLLFRSQLKDHQQH